MGNDPTLTPGAKFQRLVDIMARLRSADGCPWDREQNFDTIKPYLLEETYEVLDAIDARDWHNLADELGDLMLQAVFFAQMASEQGSFRIEDSLVAIYDKLVRRHPHVFGDGTAQTAGEVIQRWEEIKVDERKKQGKRIEGLLSSVPRSLPALVEAQQIAKKAADVGFDWSTPEQVIEKLHEELDEFNQARQSESPEQLEDELGDILFVVVNIARFFQVNAEQALRKTNAKFRRRFGYLEQRLSAAGTSSAEASLDQMEELWQQAKRQE